jgi:hypothetical protein
MNKLSGCRTQRVKVANTKTHYWITLKSAHKFAMYCPDMHFNTMTRESYYYDLNNYVPQPKSTVLHDKCNVICIRCKKWPGYGDCAHFCFLISVLRATFTVVSQLNFKYHIYANIRQFPSQSSVVRKIPI